MNENPQSRFEGWAIVELFGHQQEFGYVTTMYFGPACMMRVEVPEMPEREWVLERPERGEDYSLLPVGTKVKRAAVPARSPLINPASVYRLNPCTEEVVRAAMERSISRPLIVTEMPKERQIGPAIIEYDPSKCVHCRVGNVPRASNGRLVHDLGDGADVATCEGQADPAAPAWEDTPCEMCGAAAGKPCMPECSMAEQRLG